MWQPVKWLIEIAVLLFLGWMAVLIYLNSLKYFYPYSIPSRFLQEKRDWFGIYLPALYGHIITSGVVLIAGFISISGSIRKASLPLHRNAGRLYVFLVLFVSAPCGFIMSFFAIDRGIWSMLNFLLLSTFWAYFTWQGWRSILKKDIKMHRAWMLRSFALTLSAVALRWYSALFVYFWQWRGETAYVVAAWASWLPNLLFVEMYLALKKTSKPELSK